MLDDVDKELIRARARYVRMAFNNTPSVAHQTAVVMFTTSVLTNPLSVRYFIYPASMVNDKNSGGAVIENTPWWKIKGHLR